MPTRKLKSAEVIHDFVHGDEFKNLDLNTKQQLATQLAGAENELDLVFPSLLTQAKTPDQRRFLLALVEVSETPASAPEENSVAAQEPPPTPAAEATHEEVETGEQHHA